MPKPIYSVVLKNSHEAIDIDDIEDLSLARFLWNYKT